MGMIILENSNTINAPPPLTNFGYNKMSNSILKLWKRNLKILQDENIPRRNSKISII